MENITIFVLVAAFCVVSCKPLENEQNIAAELTDDVGFLSDVLDDSSVGGLRKKRSEENCEKLELCQLHARSRHSLFAAYELYFVNRENARLWDHRSRSLQDCHERYTCDRK